MVARRWVMAAVVVGVLGCGDDSDGEAVAEPTWAPSVDVDEVETERAPRPATDPEPAPEAPPEAPPEPSPVAVTLDSEDAIERALRDAQGSVARVSVLTDAARGLDLDFNWVVGHFVHTACDEADLATWLGWAREDGLSFYEIAPSEPFHCTSDLSLCASCPEDISSCENGYVFELAVDGEGRRYLYGVIASPERAEAWWDLTPTTLETARRARADLGAQTESGVKCGLRTRLLAGELASVWVESAAAGGRRASQLEGEDAASFARDLGARFGLGAYCDDRHCVLSGERETFGVYFTRRRRRRRRPPPPPRITVVTRGPAECEGCAPEPSDEVLARARRRRR